MDVDDLKQFKTNIDNLIEIRGNKEKYALPSEESSRKNARRSIVLKKSVKAGHILTEKDLTYKRPGTGISPKYWDHIMDRKVIKSLNADHILKWQDLEILEESTKG